MNPDVIRAIPDLVRRGVLPAEAAPALLRVARRELVSVRAELRLVLYAGVLLVTSGVSLLVKENLDRAGPVAIAAALTLAVAGCFVWVARHAPPFSWDEVPSPNLAFDYVLLLGVLLFGVDLAYVEVQFTPLGSEWTWHLLLVSIVTAIVAFRYDSRIVLSLACTTFAAWRGVAVSFQAFERSLFGGGAAAVRWNALACGVLFVSLGAVLVRRARKPHFEPVAAHLGWLLVLGALLAGAAAPRGFPTAWSLALLAAGAGLAASAYHRRRFPFFAFGVVGAYAGLSMLFLRAASSGTLRWLWFLLTSIAVLAGLLAAHARMKEPLS